MYYAEGFSHTTCVGSLKVWLKWCAYTISILHVHVARVHMHLHTAAAMMTRHAVDGFVGTVARWDRHVAAVAPA